MTRSGVEQMLYLMDSAFDGKDWHSVLTNLSSVAYEDWSWSPPGGRRTIASLVGELGTCKYVYDSQAFGDGSMHWNKLGSVPAAAADATLSEVLEWLRHAHQRLRDHVAALEDDSELLRPRLGPSGKQHETRWIINTMVQHDLYHAGEINHLRALRQGND
jgi:hypothetical protein